MGNGSRHSFRTNLNARLQGKSFRTHLPGISFGTKPQDTASNFVSEHCFRTKLEDKASGHQSFRTKLEDKASRHSFRTKLQNIDSGQSLRNSFRTKPQDTASGLSLRTKA